MTQTLLKYCH